MSGKIESLIERMRFRLEDAQEAAWAARRTWDSPDHHVRTLAGIVPTGSEAESKILSHPAMQAELLWQEHQLEHLANLEGEQDIGDLLSRLREESGHTAADLFEAMAELQAPSNTEKPPAASKPTQPISGPRNDRSGSQSRVNMRPMTEGCLPDSDPGRQ